MRVNLDGIFFSDPRVELLGRLSGESKLMARGRLNGVWHFCYEKTRDLLTAEEIGIYSEFGKEYAELMASANLAEKKDDGTYRIKGAAERYEFAIAYKETKSLAGKKSAEARAKKYGSANPRSNIREHCEHREQNPENLGTPREQATNTCSQNTEQPVNSVHENVNSCERSYSYSSSSSFLTPPKGGESKPAVVDPPSAPFLFSLWNENSKSILPKINLKTLQRGSKRHRAAAQRIREVPDEEYWLQVIAKINASSFCCGKNDRCWLATIDWLIRPETHVRVMEGQYDDKKGYVGRSDEEMLKLLGD